MTKRRLCLLDLGAHGEAVNDVSVQTFAGNSIFGTATTELHTVSKHTSMTFTANGKMKFSSCQKKEKLDLLKLLSCMLPRCIE